MQIATHHHIGPDNLRIRAHLVRARLAVETIDGAGRQLRERRFVRLVVVWFHYCCRLFHQLLPSLLGCDALGGDNWFDLLIVVVRMGMIE